MTDAIRLVLKRYWGHDGFWPLQKEAMRCVLAGRDSIVVLPTGGGKSLCLQAPAMVKRGLTLVVSPLLSLMKDQVDTLLDNGITAAVCRQNPIGAGFWPYSRRSKTFSKCPTVQPGRLEGNHA